MTQTQLASMFMGKPIELDDDLIDSIPKDTISQIHIVDGQAGTILDHISPKFIINDGNHKRSLENTLETFDAIVLNGTHTEHLEKRNRVLIFDEDYTLREFVLSEVVKYRDPEGYKVQLFASASYLELKKASILYPDEFTRTASQHAGWTLNDTGWQVGIVESSGTRQMSIETHTNPYEFLKRIAREFELELRFRVEHDGNKITGRFVDLLERVGEWQGREITFGKDLDGIRRIEKQDIVTALLGLGPEDENGNRLEVLVEDEDALQRWGRVDEHGNLHHLIEVYEIQSSRTEMTETEARQYTRTALDKRINTQVTYETTIVDLENVPGMENKKIRFGDTIRIKDEHFNPPLYLEARVYEQTRSIKSKAKKEIKLGDYIEYTEDEVHAVWNQLRNEIRKKVDIAQVREYAEPKKIESDTPPPIKQGENPIWVDTSKSVKVPHVVVADEWVKMSHDEDEISDADRLTHGVVDVGQVPLRTSSTGARIEWDGVNGFVQYNSNNEIVTHLNLDGDARFTGIIDGSVINGSDIIGGEISGTYIVGTRIDSNTYHSGSDNLVDKQVRLENANLRFLSYSITGSLLDYNVFTFNNLEVQNKYTFDIPEAVFTGSIKLENSNGFDEALEFPAGHKISVGTNNKQFFFYGNRANGQLPFVVRSHENENNGRNDLWVGTDGTLYSNPTYNNTSSNSANVRIAAVDGNYRFYRTTSARKYKHDIQVADIDYYKILDLLIHSWNDKKEYEDNGNSSEGLDRHYGLIADDVADALPQFAEFNDNGEVENYNDRIFSLLIPIVRDLKNRLDVLENGN